MTNRIDWLDTAKGIAMLMVVLQHTTGIDGYRIGVINAHISLPLFFLISGYFFKPKQCFSEFIKNKITTLLIPAVFFYWLGCFLFLTMQSVGVRVVIPFEWLRFLDIFLDTENLYCNGVVWFLIALFWICCICYVLQKAKPISLICISLLISVLSANGGGICQHMQIQLFHA